MSNKNKHPNSAITIKVFNKNIEKAIKVLQNKLSKNGVIRELRIRKQAETPGERKRRVRRENKARNKRSVLRSQRASERGK